MQSGTEDVESEEPIESDRETRWIGGPTHKFSKPFETMISHIIDSARRSEAREIAACQDAARQHVADNRYDLTAYPASAPVIQDLCQVKKRKVR